MMACKYAYGTGRMYGALFDVVDKWNMIRWMPVERVKGRIEFHGVD